MKLHDHASTPRSCSRLALATALAAACATSAASGQQVTAPAQDDPLAIYQWHLHNTGQPVFADTRPVAGNDLKVDGLFRNGIRGKGVTIAIVDDGVQIAHPDLAANVAKVAGKNFANGSNDPTPALLDLNSHGTMVAGIAAAVGGNGLGVRGVAPAATVKGFNFIERNARGGVINQSPDTLPYAWWEGAEVADVQVFNNSWGARIDLSGLPYANSPLERESFETAMSATRGGRGGIYVKAAGNNFNYSSLYTDVFGRRLTGCTGDTRRRGSGCTTAGSDPRNNYFNVITVAAVRADGVRSSYSSTGAALWVSAFGGENGHQQHYSPRSSGSYLDPAIVTTDVTGCAQGSNKNSLRQNALDSDQSSIDRSCNYTAKMNGTSAAAPMVSGVAALMLEANPRLSFRDVKYLLATTARRTHPDQPATRLADGRVLVPGWTTNAAGHAYSNWYGFGVVDAARAVQGATRFAGLGALVDSGWRDTHQAVAIGRAPATTRMSVQLANGPHRIEAVQLGFNLTHGNTRQLQFVLVSPSGTRSVVLPAFTAIGSGLRIVPPGLASATQSSFSNIDLLSSNAFLDEEGTGSWTLEVTDMGGPSRVASRDTLNSFKIRVLGH